MWIDDDNDDGGVEAHDIMQYYCTSLIWLIMLTTKLSPSVHIMYLSYIL